MTFELAESFSDVHVTFKVKLFTSFRSLYLDTQVAWQDKGHRMVWIHPLDGNRVVAGHKRDGSLSEGQ